jgi:hypothetical protein
MNIKWAHLSLLPFTLLLCLIIMTAAFIGFQNASDNGTLYIADIKGDRSVLDDVVISGVLQDRSHGIDFEMRNHKVIQNFSFYESNEAAAVEMSQPVMGNVLVEDGINYSYNLDYAVSPHANTEISIQKGIGENGQKYEEKTITADMVDVFITMKAIGYQGKKHRWDEIRFSPGTYIKSDKKSFKKTERVYYSETGNTMSQSASSVELLQNRRGIDISNNAFVMMDGSFYFTLLSTPDFKGTSGIFKIEEFSRSWMPGEGDRAQYGKIKTVAAFSLDDKNMTILGLKAVNNQLVLILLEDGMLKLRSYDAESGKMLDELEVTSLPDTELGDYYQSFIQDDRLNLGISKVLDQNSGETETSTLLISTRINDEITLLHLAEDLDLEKDELLPYHMDQMYEVNGKLFVFAYVKPGEEQRQYSYEVLEQKRYLMFVYQDGKLLYKGELVNDSDEDYVADRQKIWTFSSGYGNSESQIRLIRTLEVRGR